ncbi:hypothetical protein [Niallia sp. Krafla_26]|uniref:hypothetical protein n=1 Tax=Niallia sp. Krafla_26 TaxID=3064703 RepID=UPI003D18405B
MKRYWKLMMISLITVVVIGAYYTQASSAKKVGIGIEFEKVIGNEEELKDLIFYGDYAVGHMYQPLQITTEETVNPYDRSFLEQLSPAIHSPIFNELIKEHKTFMRGKELVPNNFYEDENVLVYASFKGDFHDFSDRDVQFDIDILNKNSEETVSIQADIPFLEKYNWMNMDDVVVIGNELKLVVRGDRTEGGSDLKLYSFDMTEKQIVGNDEIVSTEVVDNGWTDMTIFNDLHSTINPQKYYVIKLDTYEAEEVYRDGYAVSHDGEAKVVKSEVLVYNIEKNEVKQWEIPEEMMESLHAASIEQSSIYTYTVTDAGIEVSQYDFEKEEWGGKQTFDSKHSINNENPPFIKIMNEKIYIISAVNSEHILLIGDLNSGKTLYEGKLMVTDQKENPKGYRLYFNEIDSI